MWEPGRSFFYFIFLQLLFPFSFFFFLNSQGCCIAAIPAPSLNCIMFSSAYNDCSGRGSQPALRHTRGDLHENGVSASSRPVLGKLVSNSESENRKATWEVCQQSSEMTLFSTVQGHSCSYKKKKEKKRKIKTLWGYLDFSFVEHRLM